MDSVPLSPFPRASAFSYPQRRKAKRSPHRARAGAETGTAVVELAMVLPLLALLLLGGVGIGLALVADLRLEHAAGQAADAAAAGIFEEDDVAAYVAAAGGALDCYWTGTGPGGCFDDGTEVERHQVVTSATVAVPMFGDVSPTARASGLAGGS